MAHDVFISYSSKDKVVADAVTARLESKNIRCWIAPRDILPGQAYAASLIEAIQKAKVLVLILSEKSNQSKHVIREVGEAVDTGIPIIPLRIEDVQPSSEMRYYIKSLHWLDAITPPLERNIDILAKNILVLLNESVETPPDETVSAVLKKTRKPPLLILAISALAVFSLVFSFFFFDGSSKDGLTFTGFVPAHWEQTDKTSFIGKSQNKTNAMLCSDEMIKGDFTLTFSATILEDPLANDLGSVSVFIYGDGSDHSSRGLFITFGNGYDFVYRKNPYDENNIIYSSSSTPYQTGKKYDVKIVVKDSKLLVSVDNNNIINVNLPQNMEKNGYIAFMKYFESNSIKVENINIE